MAEEAWKRAVKEGFDDAAKETSIAFKACDLFDQKRRLEVTYQAGARMRVLTMRGNGPCIEPSDLDTLKHLGARAARAAIWSNWNMA